MPPTQKKSAKVAKVIKKYDTQANKALKDMSDLKKQQVTSDGLLGVMLERIGFEKDSVYDFEFNDRIEGLCKQLSKEIQTGNKLSKKTTKSYQLLEDIEKELEISCREAGEKEDASDMSLEIINKYLKKYPLASSYIEKEYR